MSQPIARAICPVRLSPAVIARTMPPLGPVISRTSNSRSISGANSGAPAGSPSKAVSRLAASSNSGVIGCSDSALPSATGAAGGNEMAMSDKSTGSR